MDASPRALARLAGLNYLIIIALGIFAELFARGGVVVAGDAAATTANLKAMESLWRLGIAAEMVMLICTVLSAMFFYVLLRPVSRDLALLSTFFSVIAIAVEAAYALHLVEALFPLGRAGYLKAFSTEQLAAMSSLSMKSHGSGFGIALLLFGPLFLIRGFLIFRSGYFPKVLGVLYQITGVAYMTNSFVMILAPRFSGRTFAIIGGPAFIGELSLTLWLLVKGIDVERWNRRCSGIPL